MSEDKAYEIVESFASGTPPRGGRIKRSTDGFSRQDVINAFARTFEMIGGVSRMALWADKNEDKFFALYSKLLPSTAIQIGEAKNVVIEHAIAPTALDRHEQ